jgi:hypothetical protein
MRVFSLFASLIVIILGLTSNPETSHASNASIRLSTPLLLTTSDQASRIRTGMSFQDVVQILGRKPDTILNDVVREEMGEYPLGLDLYSLYWKNDAFDCSPIAVSFSSLSHQVTGIDEGRVCMQGFQNMGLSDPIGQSCKNNPDCR